MAFGIALNLGFFGFFGTVSMNMLTSWPMGFSIFGFFVTVSRNKLISDFGEVL